VSVDPPIRKTRVRHGRASIARILDRSAKSDRGADHVAPDCSGQNFYATDRGLRDLLKLYLEPDDLRRLKPHFQRLGALADGRLDELARAADRHPPVLNARDRFGRDEDWIDYHSSSREIEKSRSAISSFTP
jgi:acyl-CoA dehydrogenase